MTLANRFGPHLSIGIQVCGLALGLLCNLVLARLLSADGYGVYSIVYTLVSMIGMPLEVGLAMVMVREIASLHVRQDWGRMRGAIRASTFISLAFSAVWLSSCVIFLILADTETSHYAAAALWAAFLLPIAGLAAVRGSILRGLGHPLWGQAMVAVLKPGFFLLLMAAMAIKLWTDGAGVKFSPNLALALHSAAAAIALGIGMWLMARLIPANVKSAEPSYEWRRWLANIPGYSLMAAAFAANQAIATLVLAFFDQPQAVGVYRVAELGASLVVMPLGAIAIHYSADIARLISQGNTTELRVTLRHAARVAIAAACPVALIFLVFGRELIMAAFGESYSGASLPLAILSLAQIVNTLTGLAGIVMSMGGHHREALAAVLIAIGIQLALTLWLVPSHSVTGAATSSAIATLVWSQILRLRVRKHYLISTLPS